MDEENEALCEAAADALAARRRSAGGAGSSGSSSASAGAAAPTGSGSEAAGAEQQAQHILSGHEALLQVLAQQQLLAERVRQELEVGQRYWAAEQRLCGALARTAPGAAPSLSLDDVLSTHEAKSFDYRVLHLLLHGLLARPYDEALLGFMRLDEMLIDIGDDLTDYEDDVMANSFNIYRGYIHLFGREAPMKLIERISALEAQRAAALAGLPAALQALVVKRQRDAAVEEGADRWTFPDPILDEAAFRAEQPPGLHRVKLYKLNESGGWDDKGTGLVSVGPMEFANHQSNSVGLVVIGEETQKMLMVHRILHDDIYNRQDETIITWTDPDIGTDVALSFQEGAGCNTIWQHIVRVQSDADPKHPGDRRRVIDEFDGPVGHLEGDYLHHEVLSAVPPMQRERVAALLMAPGYLRKLLDVFRQCEDLEDTASLHHLFRLMRSIIMLNDTQLLDELLKEEHVMDVMGALEYDPDLAGPQGHRAFLQTAVVFKEVVPITSAEVVSKIHQTYRITYLKDVILPRSLDDATYATLSSLTLFNNVDVVLGLYADEAFLPALFDALKRRAPGDAEWDDLVAFLQEFCSLSKHLQLQQRQALWAKMTQLGMFEVITRILQSGAAAVKLRATDVLLSALAHDPMPLRAFLATQERHALLDCLVTEFVNSRQSGLPEQIAELLKLLVDPETMDGALDKNDFMDVFYNTFLDKLIAPMTAQPPHAAAAPHGGDAPAPAAAPSGAPARAAPAALRPRRAAAAARRAAAARPKNVVEKVLRLLRRKERWLVVAGVRFLRTCVGTKDDFYLRHLLRGGLLDPVMAAFFDNGPRYNLLNSAVLELVEFIRKENIKSLIEYLVERFGHRFDEVTYVDTFKQLQLKWEQSKEAADAPAAPAGAPGEPGPGGDPGSAAFGAAGGPRRRIRRDAREPDRSEEDYFSEDGHGRAPDGGAARGGGLVGPGGGLVLVPYGDDDDDELEAAAAQAGAAQRQAQLQQQQQPGGAGGAAGLAQPQQRPAHPQHPQQQQQQQQQLMLLQQQQRQQLQLQQLHLQQQQQMQQGQPLQQQRSPDKQAGVGNGSGPEQRSPAAAPPAGGSRGDQAQQPAGAGGQQPGAGAGGGEPAQAAAGAAGLDVSPAAGAAGAADGGGGGAHTPGKRASSEGGGSPSSAGKGKRAKPSSPLVAGASPPTDQAAAGGGMDVAA
ncbi:smkA [Scenedesmus sp. PABB004]|nr:smkA [Scenedesmus sp. PABB004]